MKASKPKNLQSQTATPNNFQVVLSREKTNNIIPCPKNKMKRVISGRKSKQTINTKMMKRTSIRNGYSQRNPVIRNIIFNNNSINSYAQILTQAKKIIEAKILALSSLFYVCSDSALLLKRLLVLKLMSINMMAREYLHH